MIYENPKAIGLQSSFQIEKMVFISFMGGKPLINGNTKLVMFKTHFLGRENEYRGKEIDSIHCKRMVFISFMERKTLIRKP